MSVRENKLRGPRTSDNGQSCVRSANEMHADDGGGGGGGVGGYAGSFGLASFSLRQK